MLPICFVLAVLLTSGVCLAAECNFTNDKKFVDSNSWTYVCSAVKDADGTLAAVKITTMYDANGKVASYQQVYVRATSSGAEKLVTKGTWIDVSIPSGSQKKGNAVALYCKGHNPSLDCYISGYWNVH